MRKAVARLLLILGGGLTVLALTPGAAHADCGEVTYHAPSPAQDDPCGSAAMVGIVTAAGFAAALMTAVAVGMYLSGAMSVAAFNTMMKVLTSAALWLRFNTLRGYGWSTLRTLIRLQSAQYYRGAAHWQSVPGDEPTRPPVPDLRQRVLTARQHLRVRIHAAPARAAQAPA